MTVRRGPYTVVGIGEILWDMFPEGKQLGGAPTNFAYHTYLHGAQAYVVSSVGNDSNGREILLKLKQLGLSYEYLQTDPSHPTGTVSVTLGENRQPHYIIHEDVAWDHIAADDKLLDLAKKADAVCFGSLSQRWETSRNAIRAFLKATRPDCLRVFDINLRQHYYNEEIVNTSLKYACVLKLNIDELPEVGRLLSIKGTENDILEELIKRYLLRSIVLTYGDKGSLIYTSGYSSRHPGYKVKVADTVGAGDSFTATFVMGLLQDYDYDIINEAANRIGSYVCSTQGGTPKVSRELLESVFLNKSAK